MKSIDELAVRWVALRDEALALAEKRAQFDCQRCPSVDLDEPLEAGGKVRVPEQIQKRPCWKNWIHIDHDGMGDVEGHLAPRDEWCEPCRQRQLVHDQLRKATASRGAVLRALIRAVHREQAEENYFEPPWEIC